MRILVADDEEYSLKVLSGKIIEILPHAVVHTCKDSTKALKLARQTEYDIIFLDITMPEIQGRELAEKIHKMNPDTQILFVTGELETDVISQGIQTERCIYKPVAVEDIMEKLENLNKLPTFKLIPVTPLPVTEKKDEESKISAESLWFLKKLIQKYNKGQVKHMERENIIRFYEELAKNTQLQEQILKAQENYIGDINDREKAVNEILIPIAGKAGYDFTAEDIKKYEQEENVKNGISEEELENVSGGWKGFCPFIGISKGGLAEACVGSGVGTSGSETLGAYACWYLGIGIGATR